MMKHPARTAALLVLSVLALFLHELPGSNVYSRLDLVYAIGDTGRLSIDPYHGNTIDKSYHEGHYYSDKAFGASFLGVLPYLLCKALTVGFDPPEPFFRWGVTFLTISLPSAWLILLLLRACSPERPPSEGCGRLFAFLVVLGYAFGTPAFPFATLFFGHQLAGVFLFSSFLVLWRRQGRWGWAIVLASGLLSGAALLIEYPTGLLIGWIGLYLLWEGRSIRLLGLFTAAAILLPIVLVGWYNAFCFGDPLTFGYRTHAFAYFQEEMSHGFMGITYPRLSALLWILFSPSRGLFFLSPFLLLLLPALVRLWRQERSLAVMIGGMGVTGLLFNAAYYQPGGGYSFGPRHLVPLLPFLVVPIVRAGAGWGRGWRMMLTCALLGWSIAAATLANVTDPLFPDTFGNPLYAFSTRLLLWDGANDTLLRFSGLSAGWSLLLIAGVTLGVPGVLLLRGKCRAGAIGWGGGLLLFGGFLLSSAALSPAGALDRQKLGNYLHQRGDLPRAIALYTSALPERSHDPYLHLYLGELYQRTGEVRKAEAALRTALSLAPDLEGAWLRLATLLHERGETREAVALLEKATARLDHSVPLLVRLGVLEALLPDVARALATLDRAARIAPLSPEVWRARGDILLAQRSYPEAIEAFSHLVSLRPDDPSAHFSLGVALLEGGDLPGARDHLERALRGTKDPRQAQIARRLIESLPSDGQEEGNGVR